MRVRQPQFDFSRSAPFWTPAEPEFAQLSNSTSLIIPYLERFLNKVMAKALKEFTGDDAETQRLRRDIATFIKQKSVHYSTHDAWNDVLRADGRSRAGAVRRRDCRPLPISAGQQVNGVPDRLLRGIRNARPAFCDGVVSDKMAHYVRGADRNVEMMWRWHTLEEFEHRHVCHEVYHRIHGGYALRIYRVFLSVEIHVRHGGADRGISVLCGSPRHDRGADRRFEEAGEGRPGPYAARFYTGAVEGLPALLWPGAPSCTRPAGMTSTPSWTPIGRRRMRLPRPEATRRRPLLWPRRHRRAGCGKRAHRISPPHVASLSVRLG